MNNKNKIILMTINYIYDFLNDYEYCSKIPAYDCNKCKITKQSNKCIVFKQNEFNDKYRGKYWLEWSDGDFNYNEEIKCLLELHFAENENLFLIDPIEIRKLKNLKNL